MSVAAQDPATRFLRFIQVEPNGCWTWTGAVQRNGYGRFRIGGRRGVSEWAHRASWRLFRGLIADGLRVCHRCDNPPCVNPDHLFLGTAADNSADMVAKGRSTRGRVTGGRLTAAQRAVIRSRLAAGEHVRPIARDFGLSMGAIYAIRQGVAWRFDHIPEPTTEPAPAAGAPAETPSPRGLARRSDRSGRPPVPASVTPHQLA